MNDAHRVHDHVGVSKHENRFETGYDIMRFECVASFCTWPRQVAQVAPSSMRLTEQITHKLSRGRHKLVSRWTVHWQGALAVFKPGRKYQGGKIAAVIDMKMTELNNIHLGHLRSALTKA